MLWTMVIFDMKHLKMVCLFQLTNVEKLFFESSSGCSLYLLSKRNFRIQYCFKSDMSATNFCALSQQTSQLLALKPESHLFSKSQMDRGPVHCESDLQLTFLNRSISLSVLFSPHEINKHTIFGVHKS